MEKGRLKKTNKIFTRDLENFAVFSSFASPGQTRLEQRNCAAPEETMNFSLPLKSLPGAVTVL